MSIELIQSLYALFWGLFSSKTGSVEGLPIVSTERIFHNKDISSKRLPKWRDMRQYTQKGLEIWFRNKTHSFGIWSVVLFEYLFN